jgi:predicted nucleic-acid-binding Zn-ribbon protein
VRENTAQKELAMTIDEQLAQRFSCPKCRRSGAEVKRFAATGTGLTKIMDIQHNKYIAVSCQYCGFTELYNPDMLEGKRHLGDVLDVLFSG